MSKTQQWCANCTKSACAKQAVKDKKVVLFCSAYKPKNTP